jgi:hypothetical protein
MAKEKDVVLIYFENKPAGFARIEDISPDPNPKKRDWYHVKLLLLQIPLQVITWILRDVYIDGEEFTMGGHKMRLEPVKAPGNAQKHDREEEEEDKEEDLPKSISGAKIISFNKWKKN